jgi:hypothetical protein
MQDLLLRFLSPISLVAGASQGFPINRQVHVPLTRAVPLNGSAPVRSGGSRLLAFEPGCQGGIHLLTIQTLQRVAVRIGTRHTLP